MTGALLYQPSPRWQIGAALGAAALLHLAAIAFAGVYPRERTDEFSAPGPPVIELEPISPPAESTPPPDTLAPTPSQDATEKLFAEDNPTPPPVRRRDNQRVTPIAKMTNPNPGSLSVTSAKIVALHAPRPEYPYEARRQKLVGSGIVSIGVDPTSGYVTDVSMWQSTGSPVLDNATMTAFRRWRFKPGTAVRIKSPITYTLTGAAY